MLADIVFSVVYLIFRYYWEIQLKCALCNEIVIYVNCVYISLLCTGPYIGSQIG